MDVSVRHTATGHSCVVGVPEAGTVVELKADALEMIFAGAVNATLEAANMAAHIEGCEEELDDAERVADTGLEDGGAVQLVPRWPNVKAPAVYSSAHDNKIRSITLSGCGTLCAVSSFEECITVFDTTTAAVVANLTHGNTSIDCTAFSVCGKWLATCSYDGTICVWLTSTWEEVCMLNHNSTRVYSAAWTHCGRLVSGDNSGKIRVWDLKGTPSATVSDGHGWTVRGIADYFTSKLRLPDLKGTPRATVMEGHSNRVYSFAVSSTRIFSGSVDKSIRVWDLSTLARTHTLHEHTHWVTKIALTKDEQSLVSCSADKSLKVWCTTSLSCLRTVQLDEYPSSVAVSPRSDVVAVGILFTIKLYRLSTGECLEKVDTGGNGFVALSLCGRWIFTTTNNSTSVTVCPVPPILL